MKASDFKVGQKLWCVPGRSAPYEVTVSGVGRKWVYVRRFDGFLEDRFCPASGLHLDGGQYTSPGQIYLSQKDHEEEVALRDEIQSFLKKMDRLRYRTPDGLTIERIRRAAKELGIDQE